MKNIFDGIKVIDFSTNAAGPVASAMLADFGAEVIKVERPGAGDDTRGFPPFLDDKIGATFLYLNRGKKSIIVDTTKPEGISIIKKLIDSADVVLENYRPGTMKKLGLDYETLKKTNPKLIMCSISGYGQTGPDWFKPGYDLIAQAESGIMDLTGFVGGPPVRSGTVVADYTTGHNAFGAIATALYYREKTQQGQMIDISLVDCLVSMNSHIDLVSMGRKSGRQGNHHSMLCPFGVFTGQTGSVVICAPNPKLWANLCKAMKRPELVDDSKFSTGPNRIANINEVVETIGNWLDKFTNVDDAIKIMEENGIPCAKVKTTAEIINSEQLIAREMIIDLEMPIGTKTRFIKARGNQLKFSSHKAELKRPPNLGEHTKEILLELGCSEQQAEEFITSWNPQK